MKREKLEGVAYSYIRFSAKEQERGDSLRRQTDLRDAWLKRHPGVKLDPLTLRDLGVSAFRGLHRSGDAHALGEFLKAVESGRVAKGSLLLLENLDRLSREDELTATHLFTGLLLAGIRIVQLEPEVVFDRKSGQLEIMRAVLELGRAHAESARKSVRVGEAWAQKRKAAASSGKPMTGRCPAWLKLVGGRFEFRAGARDLIRRMFAMCTGGHGCRSIAAEFTREKVPVWGKGHWEEAYIRKVIAGRDVLGEFQPMTRGPAGGPKRVPDGDPVKGYYPAAVTEQEWFSAQAARKLRDRRGGRPTKDPEHVNPFVGMLTDARTGKSLQISGRTDRGRYYRILIPAGYKRHGDACVSFPYEAFEDAVLSELAEIDPREVLPDAGRKGDAVLELSGRLAGVEGRIAAVQAQLVEGDGDVAGLMSTVRALEVKRKETADALSAARLAAANPLMEGWGDARGLIGALKSAPDKREARMRLRSAVRRIVESVDALLLPKRGDVQFAVVQVRFRPGDRSRLYVIYHVAARGGKNKGQTRPASYGVLSGLPAPLPDTAKLVRTVGKAVERVTGKKRAPLDTDNPIDLRDPGDVLVLEALLSAFDPATGELDPEKHAANMVAAARRL